MNWPIVIALLLVLGIVYVYLTTPMSSKFISTFPNLSSNLPIIEQINLNNSHYLGKTITVNGSYKPNVSGTFPGEILDRFYFILPISFHSGINKTLSYNKNYSFTGVVGLRQVCTCPGGEIIGPYVHNTPTCGSSYLNTTVDRPELSYIYTACPTAPVAYLNVTKAVPIKT